MPILTDRQRVELAVPSYLVFALVTAGCFGADPSLDVDEGKREVERQTKALETLLAQACVEPIRDLPPRAYAKIARRVERLVRACQSDFEGQPAVKVALAYYHFLSDLIERDVLTLWDGSAMGEAMTRLFPMFEHGFAEARLDASAQKQARRLLARLQAEGYYRDASGAAASVDAEGARAA